MEKKVYPVCVIGGGSAGTMAMQRTVLNNEECLFFPGTAKDKKRSRALWVKKVENMPAHFQYKRGIEEPNAEVITFLQASEFKDLLKLQKNTGVTSLKKVNDLFEIGDSRGEIHYAQFVILCTGVMDIQPEIKGEIGSIFDYANAQTVDYCLICDGHHVLKKRASVIGHTDSAGWNAIIFHERYQAQDLAILTNGKKPVFSAEVQRLLDAYKVHVFQAPIAEVLGEEKGKVLRGFRLEDDSVVEADICFVALGLIVYNELAKMAGADLDDRGFVKADDTGATNVPGLYVAGDLRANSKKQIYTAWDSAVNAANAVNLRLRVARRSR